MQESNELLDVRRRLIFIESLANFLKPETFPESQKYRLPMLLKDLKEEVELLKQEMAALEAVS